MGFQQNLSDVLLTCKKCHAVLNTEAGIYCRIWGSVQGLSMKQHVSGMAIGLAEGNSYGTDFATVHLQLRSERNRIRTDEVIRFSVYMHMQNMD